MEDLIKRYEGVCLEVVEAFVEKYFGEADYFPIGGEFNGVCAVNDYFFSHGDMVTALQHNIPAETLFAWYDTMGKTNLLSYHRGAR